MSGTDAATFWDRIARRYDRVYAPSRDESRMRMARVTDALSPRSRILDLGVGTGRELPALLDAGHTVVGLDMSAEMLAICAKRARPITLVQGDLWDSLPWDDASFDAILALHGTLAHPPSDAALRRFPLEVSRLLRRPGTFVAEVPTVEWFEHAVTPPAAGVVRLGEGRGRFVDDATGATIDARVLSRDAWSALFLPVFALRVEPVGRGELLLVGRRGGDAV